MPFDRLARIARTNRVGFSAINLRLGLLAYYRFNDLTDSSGNGRDLSSADATFTGAGLIGSALASGSTISSSDLGIATNLTLAAWIKVNGVFTGTGPSLSVGKVAPLATIAQCQMIGDGVSVTASFSDGAGFAANSNALADGWHHFLFTRNGRDCSAYVDGGLIGTFTSSVSPAAVVGKWGISSSGPDATEIVDEMGVWSRVLTNTEALVLYNGGHGKDPTR